MVKKNKPRVSVEQEGGLDTSGSDVDSFVKEPLASITKGVQKRPSRHPNQRIPENIP